MRRIFQGVGIFAWKFKAERCSLSLLEAALSLLNKRSGDARSIAVDVIVYYNSQTWQTDVQTNGRTSASHYGGVKTLSAQCGHAKNRAIVMENMNVIVVVYIAWTAVTCAFAACYVLRMAVSVNWQTSQLNLSTHLWNCTVKSLINNRGYLIWMLIGLMSIFKCDSYAYNFVRLASLYPFHL